MGTPPFLLWMTVFCVVLAGLEHVGAREPAVRQARWASPLLTLMLSLQASYAAPLLLLAQNRQDDRDRVSLTEDRSGPSGTCTTPST